VYGEWPSESSRGKECSLMTATSASSARRHVTPIASDPPARRSSCNRSGSWRSLLLLERERHHGEVPVAEPLIDHLLPFLSQARKGGETVVAGRLQGEAHVLERERQSELG
jgi:hypothetical protein